MNEVRLERWLEDLHSGSNEAVIAAAKALLELGDCGSPAGTYPLMGAKAALRGWRLADAVVLLHHGLRIAEPNTKVWAELLVNRAIACAHHGFYRDSVTAGEQFFQAAPSLPAETASFLPYAHHAVGLAHDRMKEYLVAANHYRLAAELYQDPIQRAIAQSDLAYALTLAGNVAEADTVLANVADTGEVFCTFVHACTTALVQYHQHLLTEALAASERAEALALGNEKLWANPLAELWYWQSHMVWELGDRYKAAALALRAAVAADQLWNLDLRDRASDWLAEIMDKGGIHSA